MCHSEISGTKNNEKISKPIWKRNYRQRSNSYSEADISSIVMKVRRQHHSFKVTLKSRTDKTCTGEIKASHHPWLFTGGNSEGHNSGRGKKKRFHMECLRCRK